MPATPAGCSLRYGHHPGRQPAVVKPDHGQTHCEQDHPIQAGHLRQTVSPDMFGSVRRSVAKAFQVPVIQRKLS